MSIRPSAGRHFPSARRHSNSAQFSRFAFSSIVGMAVFAASASFNPALAQHTLDRVASNMRINIGYRDDAMPFSYLDADKKPTGYALDFCREVVEKIRERPGMGNLTAHYVQVPIDQIIGYVRRGNVDLMCSSTSDTPARRDQIGFSRPIYFTGVRILVKTANAADMTQIKGKSIGVINGSTAMKALESYSDAKAMDWKLTKLLNGDAGISQLQLGWVAGFARDDVPLMVQALKLPSPEDYKMLPERLSVETLAIAFRKGDTAIQKLVDQVIAESAANGKVGEWYDKSFMQPLPGLSKPLNIPMSDELKTSLAAPPVLAKK